MKTWSPIILFTISWILIFYALYLVLKENIKVAPFAMQATEGRLHYNMKNSTRFLGDPDMIKHQINRAVYLNDSMVPAFSNWIEEAQAYLTVNNSSAHQILLPMGDADSVIAWALPGLFWACYARCPVFFLPQNGQPETYDSIVNTAIQHGIHLYVLAPSTVIADSIIDLFRGEIPVTRVAGQTFAEHAVKIAEYRDNETGFGWGRTYARRNGYFEYVITTPFEVRLVLSALPLAQSNLAAFLFTAEDGSVPRSTDAYLWKQRADWFVTPSEGPFRHLWIIGAKTSYASQARMDHAFEKGPYPSKGPTALGPLEGLAIVFIALGLTGGAFVLLHSLLLLPRELIGMRLAWVTTAALVPIIGVILYFAAYRHIRVEKNSMAYYQRPSSILAASATAMGFGYGAPLMMTIAFLFAFFGFPLLYGEWAIRGWSFIFGSGMVIMMITMWVGAIIFAWIAAQFPMHLVLMPHMARKQILLKTLLITFISMSAVSLGMMSTSWWLHMWRLPMMPHEDEILFMGSLWLASCIGFLIAWPLNYPMVRTGLKSGDK